MELSYPEITFTGVAANIQRCARLPIAQHFYGWASVRVLDHSRFTIPFDLDPIRAVGSANVVNGNITVFEMRENLVIIRTNKI